MAYVSSSIPKLTTVNRSLKPRAGYNLVNAKVFTKAGKPLDSLHSFSCPYCKLILRNPHQLLECGCRYCEPCLESLLNSGDKRCPEDGEPISKNEVRLDKGCLREINSLTVECPGKERSCDWTGGLINYEAHFDDCPHVLTNCVHCGEEIIRSQLPEHILNCPVAIKQDDTKEDDNASVTSFYSKSSGIGSMVNCIYPGCTFTGDIEAVNEHSMEHIHSLAQLVMAMQNEIVDIQNDYTQIKKREEELQTVVLDYEREFETMKQTVSTIPALQQQVVNLQKELTEVRRIETDSAHTRSGSSGASSTSGSMFSSLGSTSYGKPFGGGSANELKSLGPRVTQLEHDINYLKPLVEATKSEINNQRGQLAGYIDTVQTMQESVTRQTVTMEEIKLRQDILDVKTVHGIFIWKIPEIARRYRDAQDKRTISLYSPPFHTSPHGYRSCIRAYLNGDGSGKGSHISVFFVLMKSEHDNLLKWPFERPVTFELVNQENKAQSITETFMPDKRSASFKQPTSEMNVASGFPRFAPHSVLSQHQFIKGDALYIKCKIDTNGLNFD